MRNLYHAPRLDDPGVGIRFVPEIWYDLAGSAWFHHLDADEAVLLLDQPIRHHAHI